MVAFYEDSCVYCAYVCMCVGLLPCVCVCLCVLCVHVCVLVVYAGCVGAWVLGVCFAAAAADRLWLETLSRCAGVSSSHPISSCSPQGDKRLPVSTWRCGLHGDLV